MRTPPSPPPTPDDLFGQIRDIRGVAEAAGVRGVPTLVTEDGESHWGMGGLAAFTSSGKPLVPRT